MASLAKSTVGLRVSGEQLDPNDLVMLLKYRPSTALTTTLKQVRRGTGPDAPTQQIWSLGYQETDATDLEAKLVALLGQLTDDLRAWAQLTSKYGADLFCGLFMDTSNEGFELSPQLLRTIADRGLKVGFDIYSSID